MLLAGRLIGDGHRRAEADDVGVVGAFHDARGPQPLGEALDLRLQVRLVFLGDVVLGVLLEIAQLACGLDADGHLGATLGFEVGDLGAQGREALRSDLLGFQHPGSLAVTHP